MPVRLDPHEMERFAEEYGLAAMFDHFGMDGLGNEVSRLQAVVKAAERAHLFHSSACPLVSDMAWDRVNPNERRECTCGIEELRYRLRMFKALDY